LGLYEIFLTAGSLANRYYARHVLSNSELVYAAKLQQTDRIMVPLTCGRTANALHYNDLLAATYFPSTCFPLS